MANDEHTIDDSMMFAKKYLEDLLSFFGLNTEVHASNSDDEVIELDVPTSHLNGFLIGQRGETMHALQFLTSSALRNAGHATSRINIDVADYKKQRADRLRVKAEDWVKQVKDNGQPLDLKPMNAADRRVIHQLAADNGLATESVGDGRDRHIVLKSVDAVPSDDEASS